MSDIELTPEDVMNHSAFLELIRPRMSDLEVRWVDYAYDTAKYGHRNQFRDNGERYFEHCRRTALILIQKFRIWDFEMIMAALMHDMLEDSFLLTDERIELVFGERVAHLVRMVTKPKKDDPRFLGDDAGRHKFYFDRLRSANSDVKLIKLCDRWQNDSEIDNCAPEKIKRKLKETRDVYIPMIDDIEGNYVFTARILRTELTKIQDAHR